MTDDLESRLRAADPLKSADSNRPPSSWIAELVETTMKRDSAAPRHRWPLVAAAAAIVTLALGGYAMAQNELESTDAVSTASARPMELTTTQRGSSQMASCLPFSVDVLAGMPVAFAGTAVAVDEEAVLLDVDHWYRGGEASQVEISTPDRSTVSLEGGAAFTDGQRYLVTATRGVVNGCGFTTIWSAERATDFDEAFG